MADSTTPDLEDIRLQMQSQLNQRLAHIDEMENRATALKAKEDQLRMELRRAEGKKTARASNLSAKKGVVKKKEEMYVSHRNQINKMMENCRQLDISAANLKIEEKSIVEEATLSMLEVVKKEKQNTLFILCAEVHTAKIRNEMDSEMSALTSQVNQLSTNNGQVSNSSTNALQHDCMLEERRIAKIEKDIEAIKNQVRIKTADCKTRKIAYEVDIENMDPNLPLGQQKLAELQHIRN